MDLNRNAFRIVEHLTGGSKPVSAKAVKAGRIGGRARAAKLTTEERVSIAVKANKARWSKTTPEN